MLTPSSPTIIARMIHQDFPHSGAVVPAAFTDALAALDTTYDLTGKVLEVSDPTFNRDLAAAATAAVAADRDLTTDPAITALLDRKRLADAGIRGLIMHEVEQLRRGIIIDYTDELLAALTTAFDSAAADVQAARDAIGPDLDLSHAAAVSHVPAQHMTTWGRAYEATQRITKVGQLWEMIAGFAGLIGAVQDLMRPLIAADLTAEQLAQIPGSRRPMNGPVLAGFPLDLATPAEFAQRCERVRAEWEAGAPKTAPVLYEAVDHRGQVVVVAG